MILNLVSYISLIIALLISVAYFTFDERQTQSVERKAENL